MKFFACCVLLLLLSSFALAEELDASVVGITQVSNSAYTLVSSDGSAVRIAASNCKTSVQTDPSFELNVQRSPACTQSGVPVRISYYDFASGQWSGEGALPSCSLPIDVSCKAQFPIKLGGRGKGEVTQELLKLTAACNDVEYSRTFTFTIAHAPNNAENSALEKISSVEQIINRARSLSSECGSCCGQLETHITVAEAKLNEAKNYLKECDLAKSLSTGAEAFTLAKQAEDSLKNKSAECKTETLVPTQPLENDSGQQAPPEQPAVQAGNKTTNAQAGNGSSNAPSSLPEQPAPGKLCPLLFVFPLAGLFALAVRSR